MAIDKESTPYFDLSDDEVAKAYQQVLARSGYNIQAREFNTSQGLLQDRIRSVGSLIAKDGTIVEGCALNTNLNPTLGQQMTLSIGSGRVYIDGRVWDVPAAGPFSIGYPPASSLANITVDVILTSVIITEAEDNTLRSPALNYPNYNFPGAHRIKTTAAFALNSSELGGVTVYTLVQGVPLKLSATGAFSELEPILARQNYDKHGNFLVAGLDLRFVGEDTDAFELQDTVKPVPGSEDVYTATVTASEEQHPYGHDWTNRIVAQGGSPSFTHDDIGRVITLTGVDEYEGSYTIRNVITPAELEIDGKLPYIDGLSKVVSWTVKEMPENFSYTVDSGKAFVLGYEVTKPVSSRLSIPRASSTKTGTNEPFNFAFREHSRLFRNQPFKTIAGEGLTANVYYGMGLSGEQSGHIISGTTPGPTRVSASPGEDLSLFLPGSGNYLYSIVAAAQDQPGDAASWEWHLDPADPLYPGTFIGGLTFYDQADPLNPSPGTGYTQVGDTIEWTGISGSEQPEDNPYKLMVVSTFVLDPDVDYRTRSNATARMYPTAGAVTNTSTSPATSNALFFPQESYDLSSDLTFGFLVDGVQVDIDFSDPKWETMDGILITNLADVSIESVVNAINSEATASFQDQGLENNGVCTATLENDPAGPVRGWVTLQSFKTGSNSSISITSGNVALGFPFGRPAVSGKDESESTYGDVLDLGASRIGNLIPFSGGNTRDLQADYDSILFRKDLITLDKNGVVSVLSGEPDVRSQYKAPNGTLSTLALASIDFLPTIQQSVVTNYEIARTTMAQLRRLASRVENLEYKDAQFDLDREALSEEVQADVSGSFSDGFIGFAKADPSFNEGSVTFDSTIDILNKELRLPHVEEVGDLYRSGTGVNTSQTSLYTGGASLYTLPRSSTRNLIVQDKATEFLYLNSLGVYAREPKIKVTPHFNNYVPLDRNVTVQDTVVTPSTITNIVKPRVTRQLAEEEARDSAIRTSTATSVTDVNESASATISVDSSATILERAQTFLPRTTVHIYGSGFPSLEPRIRVTFNGVMVPLSYTSGEVGPDSDSYQTVPASVGTIQATSKGAFHAWFTIPDNVYRLLGHRVEAVSDTTTTQKAVTVYKNWAWPRHQVEDAYLLDDPGFIRRVPSEHAYQASLAQTFKVTEDTVLTSLILYFGAVSSAGPCVVQIRNVTNGVPGNITYFEKVIRYDDSPAPAASSTGSSPFTITFDDPLLITSNQEYAIVINSPVQNGWSLAIGRIGKKDLVSGATVSQQPFTVGKILTSMNAGEWVSVDDADLKFTFQEAVHSSSGQLVFTSLTPSATFTQMLLLTESLAMKGSRVEWFYSVDSGTNFFPITPFDLTSVEPLGLKTSVVIKAVLSSTDGKATPFILKDPASIATRYYKGTGEYVMKRTTTPSGGEYSEVRQTIKMKHNEGGSWKLYFGYSDYLGATQWVEAEVDGTAVSLKNGFYKYSYRTRVPVTPPDTTLPSKMTSDEPPVLDPIFTTTADFSFKVTTWDGAAIVPYTVTVLIVDWPDTTSNPEEVRDTINTAAALVHSSLATIASVDERNRVVLTHPQSNGPQKNAIEVLVDNADLGFTSADNDLGGTITATVDAAAGTPGGLFDSSKYAYYLLVAANGLGSTSLDGMTDFDLLVSDAPPVDGDAVNLDFEIGGKSLDAQSEELYVYRTLTTATPDATQTFSGWQLIATVTLEGVGSFVPGNQVIDDGTDTTEALSWGDILAAHADPALASLDSFRARIHLESSIAGVSPQVRDLTNVFIRTDAIAP